MLSGGAYTFSGSSGCSVIVWSALKGGPSAGLQTHKPDHEGPSPRASLCSMRAPIARKTPPPARPPPDTWPIGCQESMRESATGAAVARCAVLLQKCAALWQPCVQHAACCCNHVLRCVVARCTRALQRVALRSSALQRTAGCIAASARLGTGTYVPWAARGSAPPAGTWASLLRASGGPPVGGPGISWALKDPWCQEEVDASADVCRL